MGLYNTWKYNMSTKCCLLAWVTLGDFAYRYLLEWRRLIAWCDWVVAATHARRQVTILSRDEYGMFYFLSYWSPVANLEIAQANPGDTVA